LWSLNFEKISALLPEGMGAIALESGTCRGNGARGLAKRFGRVITIELSAELHSLAKARLESEGFTNVEAVHGNSAEQLACILPTLSSSGPLFIFLDAHWSGDSRVDWKSSAWRGYGLDTAHLGPSQGLPSSEQQCPLAEELLAILRHWPGAAHILIDDMKNIPGKGDPSPEPSFAGEDWSHLSRDMLLRIVSPRLERLHELSQPEQWLLVIKPDAHAATRHYTAP
jgi:hypothetical protein